MNAVTKKVVKMIGPMVIKELVDAIFNEKVLTGFRDDIVMFLRAATKKTKIELDDKMVDYLVQTIMEPGKFTDETRSLCKTLRNYVINNSVKWDDVVFLPIIDRIEALGVTSEAAEE